MLVIGHRGARGLFIENSLDLFRAALESGADIIEFDIQATNDDHLIVCHSMGSPKKVFGITRPIDDLSWRELQKYKNKDGEQIPIFDEVMDVIGKKQVMVDIKNLGAANIFVEALKNKGYKNVWLVNSLLPEALAIVKKSYPNLNLSLQAYKRPFKTIRLAKKMGLSHIGLVLYLLNPLTYWVARRLGLQILVYQNYASFLLTWPWFVRILIFLYPNIDVITDRPDKLALLSEKSQ